MREMTGIKLKVYYSRFYPVFYVLLAFVLTLLISFSFFISQRAPLYYELIFIALLIFRAIQFLRVPYFLISESELIILNRVGKNHKKYRYNQLEDFHFEKNKLFVLINGKSKKVKISRLFVSKSNWERLRSLIVLSDLKNELH